MSLRADTIRLAASLPKDSSVRQALLHAVAGIWDTDDTEVEEEPEGPKSTDPRRKKIERLLKTEGLTEGYRGDWSEVQRYSGRGMYGAASPYAVSLHGRQHGPQSSLGKKLIRQGMSYDNMGMGWIYYFRA